MARAPLRLHQELLLLALHDTKGTLAFGQMQHVGLGGGIFSELLLEERLRLVTEKRGRKEKTFVEVANRTRTREDVLDLALERLSAAKRRANPRDTVLRIARIKRLRHHVGLELVRRGVLRATEDEILLFFRRKVYPTLDPGPERALIERIRAALEDRDAGAPDGRTALLISLAHATGTLRALYDRKALKALKVRIEGLVAEAGEAGDATTAAIQAAQAAAATTAAVTAATAAAASG
ncbi:MAG: GPP34 family phosphoprotein [Gemmatimonadetes bacterium]|nr:GPP34 family phosphoprotein [Gemmatimonadota bacterium]